MDKKFCKTDHFGRGRDAFELRDAMDQKTVVGVIPKELRGRTPAEIQGSMDLERIVRDLRSSHSFTVAPPGVEKVFLVTTLLHGNKMCFVVTDNRIFLVPLVITNKDVFKLNSVLECYITPGEESPRVLWVTDVLLFCGQRVGDIPYQVRKLIAEVFSRITVKHREGVDAVVLRATEHFDMDMLCEKIAGKPRVRGHRVVLHPEKGLLDGVDKSFMYFKVI